MIERMFGGVKTRRYIDIGGGLWHNEKTIVLTVNDGRKRMIRPYSLGNVMLKDAYCVNAFEKDVAYLKELDEERLLAGFYENAGLKNKKMRYGGWENMLIGGHTLGHYLTAAAQAYANALISPSDRKVLFDKIKTIIDGLLECQENSKGKPGFVFGAVVRDPENVELQFDLVEQNRTNIITEAWVPWYTMHKILDGVVNVYELTAYEPALKLGSGIGDWTYGRTSSWSEETHRTVLGIEYGGMNDALYQLYKNTGRAEHLAAAHAFDEDSLFKAVASGEKDILNNHHANTTIPKFLGALNRYLAVGEEAGEYLKYAERFWDMVVTRHTYITGGNSEWEHFGEDYVLDAERTNCNNETCNTYNMLKMSRLLFMVSGERKYADYYENTLINAILSSQNPQTGMTMYFQPMATGYYKVYGEPFDKFWCCTGSGMENFTKLNDSIYFKDGKDIYVNLFLSSELEDKELGIKLIQETALPLENRVCFTIMTKAETEAAIHIRIPSWAEGKSVHISSEGVSVINEEGEYLTVRGGFKDGDKLEVVFGMGVSAEGLPDCDNVFAFRYGPVVLSAGLGNKNMIDGTTGVNVTIPTNKIVESEYLTVAEGSISDFIGNIKEHLLRDGDTLRFILKGTDRELGFTPHYTKTRERYGIYWYFLDKDSDREEEMDRRKEEEKRRLNTLDVVQPGYGQYEMDTLHAMEDKGSVGSTEKGTSRMAAPGGGFGYHMKAVSGSRLLLELHLLREDNGKLLKVFAGDEQIFEGRLHYTGRKEEYVKTLTLPAEMVERQLEKRIVDGEEVSTLFISFKGGMYVGSARVYGFIYLIKD